MTLNITCGYSGTDENNEATRFVIKIGIVTKFFDYKSWWGCYQICNPMPANMRLFAVILILRYEQKCKVRSKFLKN